MSLTESIDYRLIHEVQKQNNGIAKVSIRINSVEIVAQTEGGCYLNIHAKGDVTTFILKPDDCQHLAQLLMACA